MKIDYKFEQAYPFENGVARVKLHGKTGLIDRTGTFISQPEHESISEFSEGFAIVRDDERTSNEKCGFVDSQGHYLCPGAFDNAHPFCGGPAMVAPPCSWKDYDIGCEHEHCSIAQCAWYRS